jgi:hypothetical protein
MKIEKTLLAAAFVMTCFMSSVFARSKSPYSIRGDISNEPSSAVEKIKFEGVFSNKSSKEVDSFTIVFFVLDQDGNSPLRGRNNVVLKISEVVLPDSSFSFSRNLDDYLYMSDESSFYEDEVEYECEYLYVSRIEYADGSEWSDPFGFEYF